MVGAKAIHSLFGDDSITLKKITVVFVNILDSHTQMKADWRSLKQHQTTLLESLQVHSKKFKGVVDSFQGDHVVVTFNAVLNVASHQTKAAHFALALSETFAAGLGSPAGKVADSSTTTNPLTIGVASGECLVGNMGIEGFKRFNIVGVAFTQAMVLERLCKQFKCGVLTHSLAAATMGVDTYLDAVGAFEMTTPGGATAPTVLYSLRAVKVMANEEWMYDLREKEERDMGLHLNASWVQFVKEGAAGSDLVAVKAAVSDLIQKLSDSEEAAPTFTAQQRMSLLILADALHAKTVEGSNNCLDHYLGVQGSRYYKQALLPAGKTASPALDVTQD
jgi:class 3 adenylate cyclase